jgi:hypothetical protein
MTHLFHSLVETEASLLTKHLDAAFDEVYIIRIGPEQEGFFDFYQREPRLRLCI